MPTLSKNNFFNTMRTMFGGDKVTADQLSDLLEELVNIGFELPKSDVIKKWLKKPYDDEKKAKDKEFDAMVDAHMKTLGKDKDKWEEYVEQLAGFSPVLDTDSPQFKKEYDELPNKNVPYEEWIKSKELPAIFRTRNVNPARIWYARYKEDPLRGPGYSIFPGMKRSEPREIIDPKWLEKHAEHKELMDAYRKVYNEEGTNKPFEEWLNERGKTLNIPLADIEDVRNHIIKQQNVSQDSDDPRVYTTIKEETPVAFVPLKEGEDYKSEDAIRKLMMALDSNRPWIGQTAFGFVDPERMEAARKLGSINGYRFSDAVKKLGMTPGRLAQFLESHGYGAEKSNGEIKKKEFVIEPMDFDAITDTMGGAPSVEAAEKRSKRALENTSYTHEYSGKNGFNAQERVIKDEFGNITGIRKKVKGESFSRYFDPDTNEWYTLVTTEETDPKTGKVKKVKKRMPIEDKKEEIAAARAKNDVPKVKEAESHYTNNEANQKSLNKLIERADRALNKRYGLATPTTEAEHKAKIQRALAALDPSLLPKGDEVSDARMKNVGRFASAVSFRPGDVR